MVKSGQGQGKPELGVEADLRLRQQTAFEIDEIDLPDAAGLVIELGGMLNFPGCRAGIEIAQRVARGVDRRESGGHFAGDGALQGGDGDFLGFELGRVAGANSIQSAAVEDEPAEIEAEGQLGVALFALDFRLVVIAFEIEIAEMAELGRLEGGIRRRADHRQGVFSGRREFAAVP